MAGRKEKSKDISRGAATIKGAGGLKQGKSFQLRYAIAGIVLIALVGGYFFVFRSFAATGGVYRWTPGSAGIASSDNIQVQTKRDGRNKVWFMNESTPQGSDPVEPVKFATLTLLKNKTAGYGSYCARIVPAKDSSSVKITFSGDAITLASPFYLLKPGQSNVICEAANLADGELDIQFHRADSSSKGHENTISVWEIYKARKASDCKGGAHRVHGRYDVMYTAYLLDISYAWNGRYCEQVYNTP